MVNILNDISHRDELNLNIWDYNYSKFSFSKVLFEGIQDICRIHMNNFKLHNRNHFVANILVDAGSRTELF